MPCGAGAGAGELDQRRSPDGLLRSTHSGRCLDALGRARGNGARVGLWDLMSAASSEQRQGGALGT